MLSLVGVSDLVSIEAENINPRTQFIIATRKTEIPVPKLITSIRASWCSLSNNLPRLLVEFVSFNTSCHLSSSKRLTNLCLSSNKIGCVNTRVYRLNKRGKRILLPYSIMRLDIKSTNVFVAPTGFLIILEIGSQDPSKQSRSRESIVNIYYQGVLGMKLRFVPRSTMTLRVYVTGNEWRLPSYSLYEYPTYTKYFMLKKLSSNCDNQRWLCKAVTIQESLSLRR